MLNMPELPEVETVRAGLSQLFGEKAIIARVELRRLDLRRPIPRDLTRRLAGQPVTAVRRRAKYLLIDTPVATMLCHLGMTGSWRLAPPGDERLHDHCYVHLVDGRRLAFRDPRRFGLLDLIGPGEESRHAALRDLGPEPLDAASFNSRHLITACRGRRVAIKPLIMDQRVVVGVGNIYAQEALFRAGIRPDRPAGRVSAKHLARLVTCIRRILREAIAAGGATISDFRQAGGGDGHFQTFFRVYGRTGMPCPTCRGSLRGGWIGGRGTTWCPRCQR